MSQSCLFKELYVRKIHTSSSGITCMHVDCEPRQHYRKYFQMESPVVIPLSSDKFQQTLHHVHVCRPYPEVWDAGVHLVKLRHESLNMLTPQDIWQLFHCVAERFYCVMATFSQNNLCIIILGKFVTLTSSLWPYPDSHVSIICHLMRHRASYAICGVCSTHRILSTIHTARHSCVGQLLSRSWSKPAVLPWELWYPHSCVCRHQLVPVEWVIIIIIYFFYSAPSK